MNEKKNGVRVVEIRRRERVSVRGERDARKKWERELKGRERIRLDPVQESRDGNVAHKNVAATNLP